MDNNIKSKKENSLKSKALKMFNNPLVATLVMAFVLGAVNFVTNSKSIDRDQKNSIQSMKKEIGTNYSDISEMKKNYTKVICSIAELKSNQVHIIKQLDRMTAKYYVVSESLLNKNKI